MKGCVCVMILWFEWERFQMENEQVWGMIEEH